MIHGHLKAMALARSFLSRRLHSVLIDPQSPLCIYHIIHSSTPRTHKIPPFHHKTVASSPQIQNLADTQSERKDNKKPLHVLFKGPVGLLEKTENSESKGKDDPENKKLKKKLRQLEREVRSRKKKLKQEGEAVILSEKTGHSESEGGGQSDPENKEVKSKVRKSEGKLKRLKGKSKDEEEEGVDKGEKPKKAEAKRLHDLFSNQIDHVNTHKDVKLKEPVVLKKARPRKLYHKIATVQMHKEVKQKEPVVLKELSPDVEIFVHHLYKEGYFNDANFAKGNSFDLSWFDVDYARHYILFAVQKFGKDKQEISK